MPDPQTNATAPNSAPVAMTPHGTPIVVTGVAAQPGPTPVLSPEATQLLTAALNTMPPGAVQTLLRQNWGWVLALATPLLLTTWTNLKEIWSGPAAVAAIKQEYADDHKEVSTLKTNLDALTVEVKAEIEASRKAHESLETKLDRVLWFAQHPGAPASQPQP